MNDKLEIFSKKHQVGSTFDGVKKYGRIYTTKLNYWNIYVLPRIFIALTNKNKRKEEEEKNPKKKGI